MLQCLPPVQIGYFTLDNARNNAMAMDELQHLLDMRRAADVIKFDPLNNRVRCYAHIVNICSSHIIASSTLVHKSYLTELKVPLDPGHGTSCDNSGSDDGSACSDDDDGSNDDQDYELELPDCCDGQGDSEIRDWIEGIKRDPLRHAWRVIRLLRSSDEHRTGFQKLIQDGNEGGLFIGTDKNGQRAEIIVPALQLLRDVKTRWDSVYFMLLRLRLLRPVSWSQHWRWDSKG